MLDQAVGRPEVLKTARALRALESWPQAVGSLLAPFCHPVSCTKGLLVVQAKGSSYAQEVRMRQTAILKALNDVAGEELFKEMRVTISSKGEGLR